MTNLKLLFGAAVVLVLSNAPGVCSSLDDCISACNAGNCGALGDPKMEKMCQNPQGPRAFWCSQVCSGA